MFKKGVYTTVHLINPIVYDHSESKEHQAYGRFEDIKHGFIILEKVETTEFIPLSNVTLIDQSLEDKEMWEREDKWLWQEDKIKWLKETIKDAYFSVNWKIKYDIPDFFRNLFNGDEDE